MAHKNSSDGKNQDGFGQSKTYSLGFVAAVTVIVTLAISLLNKAVLQWADRAPENIKAPEPEPPPQNILPSPENQPPDTKKQPGLKTLRDGVNGHKNSR